MRNAIIGTIITIILLGAALLIERSIRLNRPMAVKTDSQAQQSLPGKAKLRDVFTKKIVTVDSFKGKVLLINFWATWCQPCIAEMPSIANLYTALKAEGLEVISINVDENPTKVVPKFMEKLGINFPVFTDLDGTLTQSFEVVGIPFTVVATKDQKVVWAESGERDWSSDTVLVEMKKLLKE